MDVPARDLALLFRSRHPLIACETVEEKRFEALVRGVASRLDLPVWTWSAASGLSPSHPAETAVYPGHMGTTTLGAERATNPFLVKLTR